MCLIDYTEMCCFFFFKQKTAYEMRISDWRSDVCSSDLMPKRADAIAQRLVLIACPGRIAIRLDQLQDLDAYRPFGGRPLHGRIIGIVHRRSRADNVLLEEGELQSVHVDEQR